MYQFIKEEIYEDDHVIFDEGCQEERVFLVLSGAVKIVKEVHGEPIVVEVMRTGDIFGEMAWVAGIARTATARALGRTTVGVVDPDQLEKEFESMSPGMKKIFKSLVMRLKKTTENSMGVSFIRKEPRVLKTISVSYAKGTAFLETSSRDASCGGIFVQTETPLKVGEVFLLNLKINDGMGPLKIKSQVAWVREKAMQADRRPGGMGVKFLRLNKDDHNRLKKVLQNI